MYFLLCGSVFFKASLKEIRQEGRKLSAARKGGRERRMMPTEVVTLNSHAPTSNKAFLSALVAGVVLPFATLKAISLSLALRFRPKTNAALLHQNKTGKKPAAGGRRSS
jgi:hypothetical protein